MQVPPGFGQETKHSTSVTDHSCCPVTGHCSFEARSAHRRNVFPPQTQLSTLCTWQMTCALNVARKAEFNSLICQTLGHICCHAFMEHTDRWDCLTLQGKLATQGETRSHHIKHILHALVSPTFSVPLHKSRSLWRQILLSIFLVLGGCLPE